MRETRQRCSPLQSAAERLCPAGRVASRPLSKRSTASIQRTRCAADGERRYPRAHATAPTRTPPVPASGSQLFLALHHVDLSIDVLRRHLQRESRPMPAVWLMLLDLCRTHGREQTFRELALEFHQRFNVARPAWDGFPPGRDDPGLEAYPRLVKEITLAWGTHECRRLLERLLYDNRGAPAQGIHAECVQRPDRVAARRRRRARHDRAGPRRGSASAQRLRIRFGGCRRARRSRPRDRAESPLVSDLESQLDGDLRADVAPQSAIEREHPALAGDAGARMGQRSVVGAAVRHARPRRRQHACAVEGSLGGDRRCCAGWPSGCRSRERHRAGGRRHRLRRPSQSRRRRRQSTSTPFSRCTSRCAFSAAFGSCVTMMIVLPSSPFRRSSSARISSPVVAVEVAGRLVGDDQRRIGDQRPRDRHALLLAAGQLVRVVVRAVGKPDQRRARDRRARGARGATSAVSSSGSSTFSNADSTGIRL